MKKPYYYVSPCPYCGSYQTGRYVAPPLLSFLYKDYMVMESLKHGEIIKHRKNEPVINAFCLACNQEWIERIELRYLSEEELRKEIELRGTEQLLEAYMEKRGIDPNKKPLFGGIFSGFTNP